MIIDALYHLKEILLMLFTASSTSGEFHAERTSRGWAEIAQVGGVVKYKKSNSSLWIAGRSGDQLTVGDLVFVDNKSSVLLRYPILKTSIYCSSPSLFAISSKMDHILHFERRYSLFGTFGDKKIEENLIEKNSILKDVLSPFNKTFERPGDRFAAKSDVTSGKDANKPLERLEFGKSADNSESSSKKLQFDSGVFSFVREVSTLEWIFPKGDFEFYSETYPTVINVSVNNPDKLMPVYGFLWSNKSLFPKWSGVSRGKFRNVRIEAPGTYFLQAYSEDNSAASDFVRIEAKKGKTNKFLPENWSDGEARWIDD
jgi:hypothetical protein